MGLSNGAPVQHGLPGATTADMLAALIKSLGPQERDALASALGAPVQSAAVVASVTTKGRRVSTMPGIGTLPDGIAYDPTAETIRGQVSARGRTCSITAPNSGHKTADIVNAIHLALDAARMARQALDLVPEMNLRVRDLVAQVCGQYKSEASYPPTRTRRAVGPTPSRIRA